jgi:hypothetical protein
MHGYRYIRFYREPRDCYVGVYISEENWEVGLPGRHVYLVFFTFVAKIALASV